MHVPRAGRQAHTPTACVCVRLVQVNAEVEDMYKEFQREKEDLLESIRMLQDQMQLKDMVIEAFTPTEEVQKVRGGAAWVAGGGGRDEAAEEGRGRGGGESSWLGRVWVSAQL